MENIGEDEPQPIQKLPQEGAKVKERVVEEQKETGCFNSRVFEGPVVESGEDFVTRSPDWSLSSIETSNIGESLNSTTTPTTTNKRTLQIEDEVDVPPPIQTLPEEVRGYMFNKLPQNEALKLRLVCSQWEEEVKNYFNFSIRLDEDSPYLHEILKLRIKKLKIIKLSDYQMQSQNKEDPLGIVFKHPTIIEELNATIMPFRSGVISGHNLQRLLCDSQKSLKVLELDLQAEHLNNDLFASNVSYDFQNLDKIKISICPDCPSPPPHIWNKNILSQIASSNIPKLRSLAVSNWTLCTISRITDAAIPIFKLMTKNPKGLENLKILSIRPDNRFLPLNFHPNDWAASSNISNLKTLYLNFVPSSPTELNFWSNLISDQTNLEKLSCLKIIVSSNRLLKSIALNNYDTIVEIQVYSLDVKTGGPLDLSIFKNCTKLEDLLLRRDKNGPRVGIDGDIPNLINLKELPQSISKLEVHDLCILARDLLDLLNSDLYNGMKWIKIYNCGFDDRDEEIGVDFYIWGKLQLYTRTY